MLLVFGSLSPSLTRYSLELIDSADLPVVELLSIYLINVHLENLPKLLTRKYVPSLLSI